MFEYVYTEKQYKRSVRSLLISWSVVFILRVVLFLVFGWDFVYSAGNLLLISVSGIIVGVSIRTFVMHRKSARIDIEDIPKELLK